MITEAVKEIEPERWPDFCKRVSAIQADATIDIDKIGSDGSRERVAEEAMFQNVSLDRSGACSDRLTFEFGRRGETRNAYVITEPIHLRLRESENGRYKQVEIVAEDGTSVLTFRPGINPAAL